jgi:predicted RNA-binding Zn ribbon-like protein
VERKDTPMEKSLFLLGGVAWINLANTIYLDQNKKKDLLQDTVATLKWLEANELLREIDQKHLKKPNAIQELAEVLRLLRQTFREIIHEIVQTATLFEQVTEQLEKWVGNLSIVPKLTKIDQKLSLQYEGATTTDHVCYQLITSLIQTLNRISFDRIRKCEHEECILYFADTSKGGKRRWCSMEYCGNRQKAAKFYEKKKKKKV